MKDHLIALVLAIAVVGALAGFAIPAQAETHVTPAQAAQTVRYQIQSRLSTNAELNGTWVHTSVTKHHVKLTGYVHSPQSLEKVLHIARSFAGNRTIVNDIIMGGSAYQLG